MILEAERQNLMSSIYEMRQDVLTMCHNAGIHTGHLGGTMSCVEILAVLYLRHMNIIKAVKGDIFWNERDRFIMSKGHGSMTMYAALKQVGIVSQEMIDATIRGQDSILFKQPRQNFDYAIECSTGSLGQGIGYAVGIADGFYEKGLKNKVYVMVGDGECNEGSVWESAIYAAHRKLNNLTVIVDKNGLQIDGRTKDVLNMENMAERWQAFGFKTIEIDGHDIEQIDQALSFVSIDAPVAIIANTVKGKDIPFAEDKVEWHDNYLTDELYEIGKNALDLKYSACLSRKMTYAHTANKKIMPQKNNENKLELIDNKHLFTKENILYWASIGNRKIIGAAADLLSTFNDDLMVLFSDCGSRIGINDNETKRKAIHHKREVGISEQNMISMTAGMHDSGFYVWAVAYAPFITMRVMDQLKVNLGYMNKNVRLIGLLAGFANGDLSCTNIATEDIACVRSIPNMTVICPADTTEIMKTLIALQNYDAPAYIRITSPAFDKELVFDKDYDFNIDKADILKDEGDITIITCGAILREVMNVVRDLETEGLTFRVINMHTIKPIDRSAIENSLKSKLIITVEEHSIYGGLGGAVAEILSGYENNPRLKIIGIKDLYYCADTPRNLIRIAGLDYNGIKNQILEAWRECE